MSKYITHPLKLTLNASNERMFCDSATLQINLEGKNMCLFVEAYYDGALEDAIVGVIDEYKKQHEEEVRQ